jgi:hypothetical protein
LKKLLLLAGLIVVVAVAAYFWRGLEGQEPAPDRTASTDAAKAASLADTTHLRSMADALGCSSEAEFLNDLDVIVRESSRTSTDLGDQSAEGIRHRLLSTTPGTFSPRFSVSLLDGADLEACRGFLERGVATPEDVVDARRFIRALDDLLVAKAQSFRNQTFADVSVDASSLKIHKVASSLSSRIGVPDSPSTGKSRPTIPVFSIQEARQLKELGDFLRENAAVRFAFPEGQFHGLYDDLAKHTIPRISVGTLDALLRAVDAERDELIQFYQRNDSNRVEPTKIDYRVYADLFRLLARQPTLETYSAHNS